MAGNYIDRIASISWAAGTEGSPAAEAAYPVLSDWTVDPELRDTINNFEGGSMYALWSQTVGKRMAMSFGVPMFQQASIASTPPVYGKLLRMAGMSETDSGSTFIYAAASPKFATDDVAGVTYPGDIKVNIDKYLFPLVKNGVAEIAFELSAVNIPVLRVNAIGQRLTTFAVDTARVAHTYPINPVPCSGMTMTVTRVAPAVTGDASATGSTTLTDAQATFLTSGVQPGDVVTNSTDGSTGGGVVTEVTSETTLTHTALTGGSGNDWQISDVYSIAAGTVPITRALRLMLPLGNTLVEQPGMGGTNSYHEPRIAQRLGAVYAMDIEMPLRSDFDWQREIDTASGDPNRYMSFSIAHNSGGSAGTVLTWTFHAKAVGKATISRGQGGQLMAALAFEQRYDSNPLTLIVS